MAVSYKKLWKLLIDLDMKKKDLQHAAGVSSALIAKLGRNENVSTESLVKIARDYTENYVMFARDVLKEIMTHIKQS